MARALQPSFGGGEYAPSLYGRQDLARYGISGRSIENWIVRPTGGMQVRPGTKFCAEVKTSSLATRLIAFTVSETLAYVIELGHLYARFYFQGARLESGGIPVEVATPWTASEIWDVRYTQSADTLFMAHGNHATRLLKRASATSFTLSTFTPREGPFRSINSNSALLMAASGATGTITLTTNFDLFTAAMVGTLVFLEPQALGNIKPWAQGERSPGIYVGVIRRSDGKVYKCTSAPTNGGSFVECGNVRPVHELGREWDGPSSTKTADTITWSTGVEWEYLHSGYGIVEIIGYTNARTATALVKKTLPPEVVGGLGTSSGAWNASGNGVQVTFPLFGASSGSTSNYTVAIAGVPIQSDPNYTPPGGGGGDGGGGGGDSCPSVDAILPGGMRAGDVKVGDTLQLFDPETWEASTGVVTYSAQCAANLWRITTADGVVLTCSETAPIPVGSGEYRTPGELLGFNVPTLTWNVWDWDTVIDVTPLGEGPVQHITVGNRCFWVGDAEGAYLLHHNAKYEP